MKGAVNTITNREFVHAPQGSVIENNVHNYFRTAPKPVVAIFAHPDDETAMSGTLAQLAKKREVYILCATSGDAGENHHNNKEELLMLVREDELRASAEVLGVKRVSFLGFKDGSLCNNIYHDLARKIENKLQEIKPDTILTFEPHGISGHIDHIAVSNVVSYVFKRLPYIHTLMYACWSDKQRQIVEKLPEYFIYFPAGYKRSNIDKVVDISDVWDKKIASLKCHLSQKKDVEGFMLPVYQGAPKEEYFLVKQK